MSLGVRKAFANRLVGALAIATALAGSAAIVTTTAPVAAQEEAFELPRAALDIPTTSTQETVVLAGGCFWGVQAVFQHITGVLSAVSGYSGGAADTAQYGPVTTGTTGHAEAVEVVYDPQVISYAEILRVFFSVIHDPTQLNRQGPDIGTQYRSHVYYTTDEQRQVTEAYIAQLGAANIYGAPIVTRVDPLEAFYPAEPYHQDYLINNPTQPYIVYWDIPKVENTEAMFPEHWRETPITVAATRPDLV